VSASASLSGGWAAAGSAVAAEYCPAWEALGVVHAFAVRQPGVEVGVERTEAVERLGPAHAALRSELGLAGRAFCSAEQVHGAGVSVVTDAVPAVYAGADSLVTASDRVCLGIYTADCCAVFLIDPQRRVIALAHAGAKGTQRGVVPGTLHCMQKQFGCDAGGIRAVLSPCIRPPHYEWDFAAEIRLQLASAGVRSITDAGVCTGADTHKYYSYRMEKGRTGRMLALLALV
jgi:copper oxidase (laccase) domain-containing protein